MSSSNIGRDGSKRLPFRETQHHCSALYSQNFPPNPDLDHTLPLAT